MSKVKDNLTKWWSVAVTVNGTTVKFYLDGVYKDSITLSTPYSDVASGPMWIGGSQELDSLRIIGWLRNVRVYNDVLTDTEILDIHNTGGTEAASDNTHTNWPGPYGPGPFGPGLFALHAARPTRCSASLLLSLHTARFHAD